MQCPHRGVLLRLAFAYFAWGVHARWRLVPDSAMGSLHTYAGWLVSPVLASPEGAPPVDASHPVLNLWVLSLAFWSALRSPGSPAV